MTNLLFKRLVVANVASLAIILIMFAIELRIVIPPSNVGGTGNYYMDFILLVALDMMFWLALGAAVVLSILCLSARDK